MQVIVKLFNVNGIPASDGSIINRHVIEEYLASDKYKTDISGRKMVGSLTHRCRNWSTQKVYDPSISRTVGKDDSLLTIGIASPTHYVDKMWIDDSNGWVYVKATLLDEEGLDEEAIQNIRRIKGLLKQGVLLGTSAVIVGYWSNDGGKDTLVRVQSIKGFDYTTNPSWVDSTVEKVIDDNGEVLADINAERAFSATSEEAEVRTFSDLTGLDLDDVPKSSKVEGHFTSLKVKSFSFDSNVRLVDEFINEPEERVYSVATLKERVRYAKFSPRQRFRRLFLEYKLFVRQNGGKGDMDPEMEKILRSMFMTDILDIFKTITGDIMKGRQINTLIGASSLGKPIRDAAQKLQIPCRMAFNEMDKKGTVTPIRMKALQEAYLEFSKAMCNEVFSQDSIPEGLVETGGLVEGGI